MKSINKEIVLCVYEENGVSINDKILEIFRNYVKSNLQNEIF